MFWWNSHVNSRFSADSSHATLVLVWPEYESWWNSHANSRLSTLVQLLFSSDRSMGVDETPLQTLACQLSGKLSFLSSHLFPVPVWVEHESWWKSQVNFRLSTLIYFLFPSDLGMRVDESLVQTLACQLSFITCSRLSWAGELMKVSGKLSLVNSHLLPVPVWLEHERFPSLSLPNSPRLPCAFDRGLISFSLSQALGILRELYFFCIAGRRHRCSATRSTQRTPWPR